jgi:hypothetical protein
MLSDGGVAAREERNNLIAPGEECLQRVTRGHDKGRIGTIEFRPQGRV